MRVWGKGQFTIPAEIRERLGIKEDTILEVFKAGRAIVATPEKMLVKELAASVRKEMEKSGVDLKQILAELREDSRAEPPRAVTTVRLQVCSPVFPPLPEHRRRRRCFPES
ncbi:AbrB/MazE/SpoVT family DNA-binding domain-containing protein [Desulfofundulus thermosubterraneus]|uniref:AbrB/MazE/SpoVT family DNA-binding domain-containing protein n=1 Tax=Desulfofundulus thermosubterraneus TaxID=348840 RepID=UPI000A0080E8|nr:AbrB/MazE/SpoVT family DNA-binding domain-containing protein [Desulfofundulus thermosubterraneus]